MLTFALPMYENMSRVMNLYHFLIIRVNVHEHAIFCLELVT